MLVYANSFSSCFQDENGMTCLHVAARRGYTDLLTLLLTTNKFDINAKVRDFHGNYLRVIKDEIY